MTTCLGLSGFPPVFLMPIHISHNCTFFYSKIIKILFTEFLRDLELEGHKNKEMVTNQTLQSEF